MRKIRKVSVRLTDAEAEFIDQVAHMKNITFSEGLRWVLHQSLLLSLLEAPQIKEARQKLLKNIEESISSFGQLLLGAKNIRMIMFQHS